jgi:ribosomal protein L10
MAEKWIQKAKIKKGALHKELGVPEGKKIPAKKLEAAAKKPGKEGKRARLAETLKKLHK